MRALQESVARLNENFCRQAERRTEGQDMGATLCGVVYSGRDFHGFNVGDSRLYLFAEDELRQLSVDQTEGQRLLGLGLLTETELPHFPKRKALYNYNHTKGGHNMFGFEKPGVTYTRSGNMIFGSDGSTHAISGNMIFNSDGTTITNTGDMSFRSDGSTLTRKGNVAFDSRDVSYVQNGNTTFCSDGSTRHQNGNMDFGF